MMSNYSNILIPGKFRNRCVSSELLANDKRTIVVDKKRKLFKTDIKYFQKKSDNQLWN